MFLEGEEQSDSLACSIFMKLQGAWSNRDLSVDLVEEHPSSDIGHYLASPYAVHTDKANIEILSSNFLSEYSFLAHSLEVCFLVRPDNEINPSPCGSFVTWKGSRCEAEGVCRTGLQQVRFEPRRH